jgi:uncharacterized protein
MNIFFDSSSFVKLFISENGSDVVKDYFLGATEVFISALCYPEAISAFSRLVREDSINKLQFNQCKKSFLETLNNISIINISSPILIEAAQLLELSYLRTLDAIHIAQALQTKPELFITSDKKQFEAANKAGLNTKFI